MKTLLLVSICALLLTGCYVPNKSYRSAEHSLIQVLPKPETLQAHRQPDGPPCSSLSLKVRPCLAFLEFDDMGEKWDQLSQPVTAGDEIDNTTQLSNAIKVVRSAVKQDPQALIITFIHGWKHNAGPDDTNIEGFKQVLNDFFDHRYKGHRVVGIFISWRGNIVSEHWPVRQQFTYFNREATASRIPGPSLADALIAITTTAHEKDDASHHPLVVLVGHSFGGLLLERGISQTMVDQIKTQAQAIQRAREQLHDQIGLMSDSLKALSSGSTQFEALKDQAQALQKPMATSEEASEQGSGTRMEVAQSILLALEQMQNQEQSSKMAGLDEATNTAREVVNSIEQLRQSQFKPLADLVIFVNSAGAATEAKETLDFFASNHLVYSVDGKAAPLFLSVSSSADAATRLAMPIGHGLPFLNYKIRGSFRDVDQLTCFEPKTNQSRFLNPPTSQGAFFMSTAAHMAILQSHQLEEEQDPARRRSCSLAQYPPDSNVIQAYPMEDTGRCFKVEEKPERCNGTPYWIMEIDPSIVPDHSTIFTDRFLSFLAMFIPNEIQLERNQRPKLSIR